jgi:histidyl-tRNA synthetase
MENWAGEPEVLKTYAKHYQTGEVIPDALNEKIEVMKDELILVDGVDKKVWVCPYYRVWADILKRCGIGYRLKLNSLGDQHCMPQYRENLVAFIEGVESEICEDCKRRKETNPIRVLDCKNEKCQSLYENAPKLINSLCGGCEEDFAQLKRILDENGIAYEIDTNLVRGLDYYSKTAFEFVSDDIGSQSAIAGGGRYDRLVEFLDGRATPAVGFAMGIERLMELIVMPESKREGYYIGALDEEAVSLVVRLAQKKRQSEKVTIDYKAKNFKNHLKGADKAKAKYFCIIGSNELESKILTLKDLSANTQTTVELGSF